MSDKNTICYLVIVLLILFIQITTIHIEIEVAYPSY